MESMPCSSPLFCRQDSPDKGRHLVACRNIPKGRLIFAERPFLALQSLGENQSCCWVCHCCKAFVGGPDIALKRRFRRVGGVIGKGLVDDDSEESSIQPVVDSFSYTKVLEEDDPYLIVPCRQKCGHVFCSRECEQDAWMTHHRLLCTGKCQDNNHPLVQFKRLAAESNEILLLVAEWWVGQHLWYHYQEQPCVKSWRDNMCGSTSVACNGQAADFFTDWLMEPWWDVVTSDLSEQPGGFSEAAALQKSLTELCENAASLLRQALSPSADDSADDELAALKRLIPPIQALDIAKRVGACEQNAMGIRQRHPLCRDIFDREFRERKHLEIVRCLEEAGFIGDDDAEQQGSADSTPAKENNATEEIINAFTASENNRENDRGEEWDYSVGEIAEFISKLFVDEDGSVRDMATPDAPERDTQGDDLDYIFPPLDGTAMYATACKMNHSCDPNVVVLYKPTGWGRHNPLAAFCIARRDIARGEELTISYIDDDQPRDERHAALRNYGFRCECAKCESNECTDTPENNKDDPSRQSNDIFGSDSDSDESDVTSVEGTHQDADTTRESSKEKLQEKLERLNSTVNHWEHGSVPVELFGSVSSFVMRIAKTNLKDIQDEVVTKLLQQCCTGIEARDFCLLKLSGFDLEGVMFSMLQTNGRWPHTAYREVFWCCVLSAALACSHECRFLNALSMLDKGIALGLPRDDASLRDFFSYVERHGYQMNEKLGTVLGSLKPINDYGQEPLRSTVYKEALVQPIRYPIEEVEQSPSAEVFRRSYYASSSPLVIRKFAREWPAVSKWRDMESFALCHGRRLVPVELGSMMADGQGCRERMMTLRSFIVDHMTFSTRAVWKLQDATSPSSNVSYLAQHPLLEQIPILWDDILKNLPLCGIEGPSNVYIWMGTGGTRTPLHFDSYDNIFVQLVGAKYVRLYTDSERLLGAFGDVSIFGLQGNMSRLNCEMEDCKKDPDARTATYTECILLPGDCLFVPSRTLHYVRSLSMSISVSYWF